MNRIQDLTIPDGRESINPWPVFFGAIIVSAALVYGAVVTIDRRTFGPEACPYGAGRSEAGAWVCMSEADRDWIAEGCHVTGDCETPAEHKEHGAGGCRLPRRWR